MRRALLLSLVVSIGCGSSDPAANDDEMNPPGDGDASVAEGDAGDGDGDGDGYKPEPVDAESPFKIRELTLKGPAISYSPYRDGQSPDRESAPGGGRPSKEQILEDLQIVAQQWGVIRTYGAGAVTADIAAVIDENDLPIKMMVGSWLEPETSEAAMIRNEEEVVRALTIAEEHPSVVGALSVGNEVLVDWSTHKVPQDRVIYFIRKVRAATKLPVTMADNYNWWAVSGSTVAKEVDFIVIHTYPFWEKRDIDLTNPEDRVAIDYTIANYKAVKDRYPAMQITIGEAGWASLNSWNAQITPGAGTEEKQKVYVEQLNAWTKEEGILCWVFEAFDENWKGDPNNPGETEKHWGLFKADRTPKLVVKDLFPDLKPTEL